jgi:hypothetical protein
MNNWQMASLGMLVCAGVGCKMSGSSGDYIKKYTQSPELVSLKTRLNTSVQSSAQYLKTWKDTAQTKYLNSKIKPKDSTEKLKPQAAGNKTLGGAPCSITKGDYTTYTIHSFASDKPKGEGLVELTQNWEHIEILSIGCGTKAKTFRSASQVAAFLPNGTTKNGFVTPFTDEEEAELATQLLALSVSTALDNNLGCLKLQSLKGDLSGFNDMYLADILSLSNEILGACNGGYEISTLSKLLTLINTNFQNGKQNDGYLTCGYCL